MIKKRSVPDKVQQVEETMAPKPRKEARGQDRLLLPSGSTLLDLALSDTPDGGYIPGSMVNIVGDSSAGKTFLLWTTFAEAARNFLFKDYRFLYDEPETAFYMNIKKLFNLEDKKIELLKSPTIQSWLKNVMVTIKDNIPFIYGLDSFDSVGSEEERTRFDDLVKKGEASGSYKTEKARMSGELFRVIVDHLSKTKSILFVISQTRDNIGATFGEKKIRSGGNALRFYSTHEVWLHIKGHIKRRERDVGVDIIARVKKNKLTGKLRTVEFPIYFDYGVDDVLSCINWLVNEKFWGRKMGVINTCGDFIDAKEEELIQYIESNNLEPKLKSIVTESWNEIERSIATNRKPKF